MQARRAADFLTEIDSAAEIAFDHGVHALGHGGIGEDGDLGVGMICREGFDFGQLFRESLGDLIRVGWSPHGGCVDARSATVGGDAGGDEVDIFVELFGGICAEDDF